MDFRDERSIAAGGSTGNVLVGNAFEFASRRPTAIMVYAVVDDPAAADRGDIVMDVLLGTTIVAQNLQVPGFTIGQGPNRDMHLMASGVAAPGDRIVVSYRSAAAAAYGVRTLISFRPL
jgi:hypothetical protein